MIELRESFDVPANPERVWEVLADPYAVVGCVPGASIDGRDDDGTLETSVLVKFGPTRVTFRARATLELDSVARQGRLSAQGKDSVGGTRMRAAVAFAVTPGPNASGSSVAIDGTVEVSGRLASMIEGGATIVVKGMSAEFAERLANRCAAPPSHLEPPPCHPEPPPCHPERSEGSALQAQALGDTGSSTTEPARTSSTGG